MNERLEIERVPDVRIRTVFKLYLFAAGGILSGKKRPVCLSCASRTRVMNDRKAHRRNDEQHRRLILFDVSAKLFWFKLRHDHDRRPDRDRERKQHQSPCSRCSQPPLEERKPTDLPAI